MQHVILALALLISATLFSQGKTMWKIQKEAQLQLPW